MHVYISIGAQCTTPTLFEQFGVKKESLPFDWIFSTPEFVYIIMKLLLIDKIEVSDIVDNDFFVLDKRATFQDIAHFTIDDNGPYLINSKYNICFPHDKDIVSDRDKYIRRMNRLQCLLLDKDNFIYLVYVSVPSSTISNYTIDGIEPIQQLYEYIDKINTMLSEIRTNYKILVFHTKKPSNHIHCNSNILYYEISEKNSWGELLPELIDKCNTLLDTNVISK